MPASNDKDNYLGMPPGRFRTTRWSGVLAVGEGDEAKRARATEELCRTYWYPVYAFVRRQGHDLSDAQDLTQGFFAHVLEQDMFAVAQRDKGRSLHRPR